MCTAAWYTCRMEEWETKLVIGVSTAAIGYLSGWGRLHLRAKSLWVRRDDLKQTREITGESKKDRVGLAVIVKDIVKELTAAGVTDEQFKSSFAFITGEQPRRADQPPKENASPPSPPLPGDDPAKLDAEAEQCVIAGLMKFGGSATIDQIVQWQPRHPKFSSDTILTASNRLAAKMFVQPVIDGAIRFAPSLDTHPHRTADLLRLFIGRGAIIEALETDWYRNHVNEALFVEIRRVQMDLELTDDEQRECLKLVRSSPNALLYALTPDELITRHRNDHPELKDRVAGFDQNQFRRMLYFWFSQDFHHPWLAKLMRNTAKVNELRQVRYYQLKNDGEVLLEGRVTSRITVGEWHKGGYIIMVGWDEPEGWKPPPKPPQLPPPPDAEPMPN